MLNPQPFLINYMKPKTQSKTHPQRPVDVVSPSFPPHLDTSSSIPAHLTTQFTRRDAFLRRYPVHLHSVGSRRRRSALAITLLEKLADIGAEPDAFERLGG